jgi:hypothetical protein
MKCRAQRIWNERYCCRKKTALVINVLFCWQGWDHCRRCIEDDEGQRELVL